jgi:hypothetical protein
VKEVSQLRLQLLEVQRQALAKQHRVRPPRLARAPCSRSARPRLARAGGPGADPRGSTDQAEEQAAKVGEELRRFREAALRDAGVGAAAVGSSVRSVVPAAVPSAAPVAVPSAKSALSQAAAIQRRQVRQVESKARFEEYVDEVRGSAFIYFVCETLYYRFVISFVPESAIIRPFQVPDDEMHMEFVDEEASARRGDAMLRRAAAVSLSPTSHQARCRTRASATCDTPRGCGWLTRGACRACEQDDRQHEVGDEIREEIRCGRPSLSRALLRGLTADLSLASATSSPAPRKPPPSSRTPRPSATGPGSIRPRRPCRSRQACARAHAAR